MEKSLSIIELKHIFSNMKHLRTKVDDKADEKWAGPGAERAVISGAKSTRWLVISGMPQGHWARTRSHLY